MLDKIAENHVLWVKMVTNMGCPLHLVEDIVQEMYLRIDRLVKNKKKIMYDSEEVNRFYIYVTLRNLYFDYTKAKNKYTFFSYLEVDDAQQVNSPEYLYSEAEVEREEAFYRLTNKVSNEINSWHVYDAKLCNTYYKGNMSLRKISKGSKISLTSLFNSVKNYKNILKEKFMEDVEDYLNGDYHLL